MHAYLICAVKIVFIVRVSGYENGLTANIVRLRAFERPSMV